MVNRPEENRLTPKQEQWFQRVNSKPPLLRTLWLILDAIKASTTEAESSTVSKNIVAEVRKNLRIARRLRQRQ